jgi:hypothetical protein
MGLLDTLQNLKYQPDATSAGLINMGANMMMAGGPSPYPTNGLQALGAGLQGYSQGASAFNQDQAQQEKLALMQQQAQAQQQAQHQKMVIENHGKLKEIATEILTKLEQSGLKPGTPEYQDYANRVGQTYYPIVSQLTGQEIPPDKPLDVNALQYLASTTPMQASKQKIAEKVAEETALLPIRQQNITYTPVTNPGGGTDWYNAKNPGAGPLPLGAQQQPTGTTQTPTSAMQMPSKQFASPENGLINIFAPTGSTVTPTNAALSPKSQQMYQEESIKSDFEQQKSDKLLQQKQLEEARKLLELDPQKQAALSAAANNLSSYNQNLNKYYNDVKGNPLLNNATAYRARVALGADTNISNLESGGWGFVQDQIKAMRALGLSPTQMLNTETEAERFKVSITGGGTAQSMRESFDRFLTAQREAMQAYEEERKKAADKLGVKYEPLIDINTLPSARFLYVQTGQQPVGSTGVLNGKRIKVIEPGKVEVLQ